MAKALAAAEFHDTIRLEGKKNIVKGLAVDQEVTMTIKAKLTAIGRDTWDKEDPYQTFKVINISKVDPDKIPVNSVFGIPGEKK